MITLTWDEVEEIFTLITDRKPLPDKYRSILFETDEKNCNDICEEDNKCFLQTEFDKISLGRLIGVSPKTKKLFNIIRKLADEDVPVLIQGEKGTGKKIIAQTIHEIGSRGKAPFVVIECGALSEHDFDTKIFGGEKCIGLIESAQEGTIVFNQIGELAKAFQRKLIPFFRDRVIPKGKNTIPMNTRIIALTDIDLKQAMEEGNFKGDIFYYINIVSILVPALRERNEDIVILAKEFLKRYSRENQKKYRGFTDDALESLISYSWPGNVLELENCILSAVIMSEGIRITREDLVMKAPRSENDFKNKPTNLKKAKDTLEKAMLVRSLIVHQNNLTKAAVSLGISRATIYDLVKKYDIKV